MLTWGDTGCDISRTARDDLGFPDQQPPRNDYTGERAPPIRKPSNADPATAAAMRRRKQTTEIPFLRFKVFIPEMVPVGDRAPICV